MPTRIQRRRSRGWKMPAGAVYVGRPSKWGNPWTVEVWGRSLAVDLFRLEVTWWDDLRGIKKVLRFTAAEAQQELKGKDLVCWCPLDQPCHADVLLQIANAGVCRDGRPDERTQSANGDVERKGE